MSLIKIDGVQSLSAPTKAQKDAATYMFGKQGHAIVTVLDKLSRVKELRAPHIAGLLKLMKEGEDDEIIKFVNSAAGKRTLANARAFASAKTLATSIKSLKLIRVPQKWIEGHSDAAAARAQETREIRARKTAGNKPEKPIKLDNPGAADSVEHEPVVKTARAPKKTKAPAPMKDVTAPKATTVKQPKQPKADPAYKPTTKSPIALVDELAEVTARKIAAKPLKVREEYFAALRTVVQNNMPRAEVSATSTGIVTGFKSKVYTLSLADNAWMFQTGATGKAKRIGATFDIVDLLAMMDKSLLRPKPEAAKPTADVAPKAAEPVKPVAVKKTTADKWADRGLSPKIARLIPNQERRNDTFYLALASIAHAHPEFDMSRVNKYEPGNMLSITTPIGDWRLIRGEEGWPDLELYGRNSLPTVSVTTWDSARSRYVNIFESIEKGQYDTPEKLERVMDGMVTSQTRYRNEKAPYRVNYDPADQNNYDFTLINMTPDGFRKANFKTGRDFAYHYIQYEIQNRIGHENWVEFDDRGGKPTWKIECDGKNFLLEAHGSDAWDLVRTDGGTNEPIELGPSIDPYRVAKLVKQ